MFNVLDLLFYFLICVIVAGFIIKWPHSDGHSRAARTLGPIDLGEKSARVHSLDGLRAVSVLLERKT